MKILMPMSHSNLNRDSPAMKIGVVLPNWIGDVVAATQTPLATTAISFSPMSSLFRISPAADWDTIARTVARLTLRGNDFRRLRIVEGCFSRTIFKSWIVRTSGVRRSSGMKTGSDRLAARAELLYGS
ncbi:MAG: hypothetical protein O3C40_11660 [Planctomycetota bacterium]|nr:hypothetical protein [Planctomycetota bacterium]